MTIFITFFLIGIMLIILGIIIYKYNLLNLLAGYDDSKIKDKDKYANFIGKNLINTGILIIFLSIISLLFPLFIQIVFLIISISILLIFLILIINIKGKDFIKKNKK